MNNTLGTVDLLRIFPPALKYDPKMTAAAQAIAKELQRTSGEIRNNIIYARIDELDEAALDVLAHDLHVDWYDFNYPIEVKRATIRDSIKIHRRLGTKYAVETALGNVFPGTKVEEWFEYGGEPYFFRVIIDATAAEVTAEKQKAVIEKVRFYKNARSHLEKIGFQMETSGVVTIGAYHTAGTSIEVYPYVPQDVEASGTAGLGAYHTAALSVEVYPFTSNVLNGDGVAGLAAYHSRALSLEVYPLTAEELAGDGAAGLAAYCRIANEIEIFPQGAEQ